MDSDRHTRGCYTEQGGHFGLWHLTHQRKSPFHVETSQTLEGFKKGWYTLRLWVRSRGGHNGAYIAIRDHGKSEVRTHLPITSEWVQIVVSVQVRRDRCTISLVSDDNADNWANFDDIEFVPGRAELPIRGVDISSLFKSEACGGVYRTEDEKAKDALEILRSKRVNWARLRVWVDPADGYHDKAELLQMAKCLQHNRMDLLVDFHYSDTWADPGKQIKPAAWQNLTFDELRQAVYDHTYDICLGLKKQHTIPAMVQIGNELNAGMLWPDGHTWDPPNWDNLAQLLTAGYEAVKACSQKTRVMIHLANGGDNDIFH